MEIITIVILIGAVIYIAFEFFSEKKDEAIMERLMAYAPSKMEGESSTVKKEEEEEEASEFLKHAIQSLSQKFISQSKNILAQKQLLIEAGLPADEDAFLNYVSKKLIYAGFGGIFGLFLAITGSASLMMKLVLVVIFPLTGFRLPDMNVKRLAKMRADSITYTLPDAIDLLTICVEAGLGLDSAITRVAVEQEEAAPILAGEFKRVGKDILAGVPRSDAFRNLSKRVNSPELRSFLSLLIQSDRLGTSIGQSLKIYSETMRNKRKQKAEEQAAKASIKMTIPMILFILPATFIVIMAPAVISMIKIFSGSGL